MYFFLVFLMTVVVFDESVQLNCYFLVDTKLKTHAMEGFVVLLKSYLGFPKLFPDLVPANTLH